jgi:hypothetical protein
MQRGERYGRARCRAVLDGASQEIVIKEDSELFKGLFEPTQSLLPHSSGKAHLRSVR